MTRTELPEGTVVMTEEYYDAAIIGLSYDGRAIYSYRGLIEALVGQGMTQDEAIEYIDYNIINYQPARVIIADILNED